MESKNVPARKDGRVIIHFDYDCFYAAVFEAKNPALKSLPFAVQQKHIIVTCNYEARRRGLHKLQLIKEARRICPEVIIELGEDISRFRDASKELYHFIKDYSWNGKVERLGFDEVWLDVTDIVDYNMSCINRHDLGNSFYHVKQDDPSVGFSFDASRVAGHTYSEDSAKAGIDAAPDDLTLRLGLGSHLALHIRHQLEETKGYTSTVGIATNKILSKLVGNLNKPKGQTTLMPSSVDGKLDEPVATFMDGHEVGKVPGIGHKLALRLRELVLQRKIEVEWTDGGKKREPVTVAQVRNHPEVDFEKLEKLLGGPGSPHGIGYKIWCLLHGIDDSEVSQARPVPRQISIEDSYIRLDTMPELLKELTALSRSLISRMRIDLLAREDDFDEHLESDDEGTTHRQTLVGMRWLAHPKTLRLSTRPRQPLQQDGTRLRTMNRISHSCPLPNFVFLLNESVDILAEKLVRETILTMFRKLHPEKSWWNLSLVNLAVTNMAEAAGDSKSANGRDIGTMFKRQDDILKDFRVVEDDMLLYDPVEPSNDESPEPAPPSHSTHAQADAEEDEDGWIDDEGVEATTYFCDDCGSSIPAFAMVAHRRFHTPETI